MYLDQAQILLQMRQEAAQRAYRAPRRRQARIRLADRRLPVRS